MLAAMLAAVVPQGAAAAPPRRIVSLNVCTDQLLIDLVPRARIAAVSHLGADPSVSAVADKARGVPATHGEAEIVLGFDPDLVLAGEYSTPATVAMLERLGRKVVKIPLASDIESIKSAVRAVAAAVGEAARGEAAVTAFEQRLEGIATSEPGRRRPTALVYQVNGLASGAGSIADAVLQAAGFRNQSSEYRLGAAGNVPMELLAADPPDLLVLTGPVDEYRTAVADNLRHPVIAAITVKRPAVIVPWRLWLCGTPYVADAIALLVKARMRAETRAASQ